MLSGDLWMRVKPSSIKLILKCQEHLHFIKSQQNNYTFVSGDTVVKVYRLRICIICTGGRGLGSLRLHLMKTPALLLFPSLKREEKCLQCSIGCARCGFYLFVLLCFQESFDFGPSEFDV